MALSEILVCTQRRELRIGLRIGQKETAPDEVSNLARCRVHRPDMEQEIRQQDGRGSVTCQKNLGDLRVGAGRDSSGELIHRLHFATGTLRHSALVGGAVEMTRLVMKHLPADVAGSAMMLHEAPDPEIGPIDAPHIRLEGLGTVFGNRIGAEGRLVAQSSVRSALSITIPFVPTSPDSVAVAAAAAVQHLKALRDCK